MTTRAQYRSHIGKALGRNYYVSSTTTAASANAGEIIDAARVEHDEFWNGATIRIGSDDRPVRGGAGANTSRAPTIYMDRALSSTPAISTNYELLKVFTFQDVDEAIDDTFANLYPYFYDPVDDPTTLVEVAGQLEYPLSATWRDIDRVEREIQNTAPLRYRPLIEGDAYDVVVDSASLLLRVKYFPFAGLHLRVFGKMLPTLGATDASTSVHPWQVVTPGALAYLYEKGGNADAGSTSTRWEQKAVLARQQFLQRKSELSQYREARQLRYPFINAT